MLFIIIVEFFCILIIKQPLPEIGNGCCVLKSNYYKKRRCGCVRQRQDGELASSTDASRKETRHQLT